MDKSHHLSIAMPAILLAVYDVLLSMPILLTSLFVGPQGFLIGIPFLCIAAVFTAIAIHGGTCSGRVALTYSGLAALHGLVHVSYGVMTIVAGAIEYWFVIAFTAGIATLSLWIAGALFLRIADR